MGHALGPVETTYQTIGGTPLGSPVIPREYNPLPTPAQVIWTGVDASYGISDNIASRTGLSTPFENVSGRLSNVIGTYQQDSIDAAYYRTMINSGGNVGESIGVASAVNELWEQGSVRQIAGGTTTRFIGSIGGGVASFGIGSAIDISTGMPPDEAFGTNIVTSTATTGGIAVVAAIQGIPVVDVAFDAVLGVSLGVGVVNQGLRIVSPNFAQWEDGAGHGITNLWGGESGSAKFSKAGRLSISSGDGYHSGLGHGAILLLKDEVEKIAKSISNSSDNFCSDMKTINSQIPQTLEDAKTEAQNYIASLLYYNFPHLSYADVATEMSKYSTSQMYNQNEVDTANKAIDKLGEKLADVSSNIKKVANGMEEIDQASANQMYAAATSGAAMPTTYGTQTNRNW